MNRSEKNIIRRNHLYLGIGSIVSIAALVLALTVGLSSAHY